MIDAKNNSTQPDVRPLSGGHRAWPWSFLVILALLPISAFAEDGTESIDSIPPSALSAERDWSSMPEPEIQARLAEVRDEFAQNTRNLRLLEEQLSQTAPVKDLADEVKRLRGEIGALVEQLEADPAAADAISLKLQELRGQREEKEAERQVALNESAEYRTLNEFRAQLMDELRGLLTAAPRGEPPAAAPEM